MSGGGGSGTQVVEQKSEPWAEARPYLTDAMRQAQQLYRGGQGNQYFPFSTVVPFHDATMQGLNMQRALAQQGDPNIGLSQDAMRNMLMGGTSLSGVNQSQINNPLLAIAGGQSGVPLDPRFSQSLGGQAGQGDPTQGFFQNLMGGGIQNQADFSRFEGQSGPMADFFRNVAQGGLQNQTDFSQFTQGGATPAQQLLGDMATSGAQNPYLDQTFDQASRSVLDRINAQFSQGGRYGSAAHQNALQQGMNDLATNIYGGAYDADRNRQLQAAGQIQGAYSDQQQRALSAMAQQAGISEADLARQMAGGQLAQGAFSEEQQRSLQAAMQQAGISEANLARMIGGGQQLSGQFGDQFNRMLQSGQLDLAQAGQLSSVMNQNLMNQMMASQGLQSNDMQRMAMQLSAGQLSPALREAQFGDAQRLAQVGSAFENQAGLSLQDAMNRFNFEQMAPWENLARYNAIISGAGQLGSSATTTQPGQRVNPLMGGLGGFATAAGGLSALGGLGGTMGALATGPAAPFILGAGALAGLFGR